MLGVTLLEIQVTQFLVAECSAAIFIKFIFEFPTQKAKVLISLRLVVSLANSKTDSILYYSRIIS